MKLDQIFGVILILLAIYLAVSVSRGREPALLDGVDEPITLEPAEPGSNGADGGGNQVGDNKSGSGTKDNDTPTSGDNDNDNDAKARERRKRNREQPIVASSFCANAPATSKWDDLRARHDAAVRCMEGAGVVTGTKANEFNPRDAVLRGQAADAIASLIDAANRLEVDGTDLRGLPDADDPRFADVTDDTPDALAIARLDETPILQGYVDARFEPDARVTRAQMASMLDRTYQYMNRTALPVGSDMFGDDNSSPHEESINAVASAEIMPGVSRSRFAPQQSVQRDEFASYLAKILIRMEDKGRITPP